MADRRARRRWSRAESLTTTRDPFVLKVVQDETSRLSRRLNRALKEAQSRFSTPTVAPANGTPPKQADWTWCPDPGLEIIPPSGIAAVKPGTRISPDTALFHDCTRHEVTLHQTAQPHHSRKGSSRTIEVRNFEGSYLSLATDLPHQALVGLSRHHIVALDVTLKSVCQVTAYARLNLRHGPNTDHIVAKLADRDGAQTIEFDLACIRLDETRLNHAWVDLIFESPAMNRITLDHMALHRRPRADI